MQFQSDWSKGGVRPPCVQALPACDAALGAQVHLLLNHTYVPLNELAPGLQPPKPTRIWLNVTAAAVPLLGRHVNDQAQYTQQQWCVVLFAALRSS